MKGLWMNVPRHMWLLIVVFISVPVAAEYIITNFNRPYDRMYMLDDWLRHDGKPSLLQIYQTLEYGSTSHSRNRRALEVDMPALYQPCESALAMLMGSCPGSDADILVNNLALNNAMLTDDGLRGRFKVCGTYKQWDYVLHNRLNFHIPNFDGRFFFTVHVPIIHRAFENICWKDQTPERTLSDFLVRDAVGCIDQFAAKYGCDLYIGSKEQTGISDVIFELGWYQDFPQFRENLKNVRLTFRAGLSVPTAKQKNENEVFSVSLGHDGSYAIPASLGIDLDLNYCFKTGLEFQILKIFDHMKVRRVKTAWGQTDFLFPALAWTRKQYSISWKFDLYAGFEHVVDGFSAFVRYQFVKADNDSLHVQCSNGFNDHIVDSAQLLQDWIYQNIIFQVNYDAFSLPRNSWIKPQFMFFYKLPISGRRVIMAQTIGCGLSLNF